MVRFSIGYNCKQIFFKFYEIWKIVGILLRKVFLWPGLDRKITNNVNNYHLYAK